VFYFYHFNWCDVAIICILGILQSNGTVEIAKETSQAADSIVSKNILNLYARIFQNGNLVWLVNPDAFPEIAALTLGDRPMWSDNFKDMPNGALLGKQIILTDACQTLGDVGDIVLANMSGYYTISKSEGAQFAESMHLWFDQSITAFRLAFRIDGSPLIHTICIISSNLLPHYRDNCTDKIRNT